MSEGVARTRTMRRVGAEPIPGKGCAMRYEHFCGSCGKRISRFARVCPSCRTPVLLPESEGGDAR
ncbi:hypothetical protein [Eggerthella timonensis]|uniref:hypothetical protein n=1 Tax=Eggerthella timonensis TaxID=1871008 RepID=UPI0011AF6116|nr:hypothetical protein [Eggerthella timonensis]